MVTQAKELGRNGPMGETEMKLQPEEHPDTRRDVLASRETEQSYEKVSSVHRVKLGDMVNVPCLSSV